MVTRGTAYRHTRVGVKLDPAVKRSHALKAFLAGVAYKRYGGCSV